MEKKSETGKFAKGNEADILYKPVHLTRKPTLSQRLQGNRCEWCGATDTLIAHQVRSLKGLDDGKPWTVLMKKINRKTLVVCRECHAISKLGSHQGKTGYPLGRRLGSVNASFDTIRQSIYLISNACLHIVLDKLR